MLHPFINIKRIELPQLIELELLMNADKMGGSERKSINKKHSKEEKFKMVKQGKF